MNKNQKVILICTAIVIFLMLMFPPFYIVYGQGTVKFLAYHFILWEPGRLGTVNINLLMAQWLGVLLIGGLLWFMMRDSKPSK